jgi:thiol-disulfide isomerase/thioredoxin
MDGMRGVFQGGKTMVALPTVLLWTSLVAGFEPPRESAVILEFVADNCPHCRTMEATVRRLRGDGFPVHRINAQLDRAEAERFGVQGTPTYVLLVRDRPVDRIEGAASYDRITRMFREHTAGLSAAPPSTATAAPIVAPPMPTMTTPPTAPPTAVASPSPTAAPSPVAAPSPIAAPGLSAASSVVPPAADPSAARIPREAAERAALAATARLRVADEGGTSVATGTVIDAQNGYALILTCGHVFRYAGTGGQIKVDLFAPGAGGPLDGRLITFDLLRDIGLVSIRTDLQVRPIALAPSGFEPQPQTEVFSVGCDNGGQPRIERSRLTRRNGYSGPPNLEATGAPVNGRSGGGLFSTDGQLIGVCNAANEPENKGVYAAFETVHWVVTQAGLARLVPANSPAKPESSLVANTPRPIAAPPAAVAAPAAVGGDEEILLVVRTKGATDAEPRFYPLAEVPPEIWRRAMTQRPSIDPTRVAGKERGPSPNPPALPRSLEPERPESRNPIFRGQQPRGVWPFLN